MAVGILVSGGAPACKFPYGGNGAPGGRLPRMVFHVETMVVLVSWFCGRRKECILRMFCWNVVANGVPLFSMRPPAGGAPVSDVIVLPNSACRRSGGVGKRGAWLPIPSDVSWSPIDHACESWNGVPAVSGPVGPLRGSYASQAPVSGLTPWLSPAGRGWCARSSSASPRGRTPAGVCPQSLCWTLPHGSLWVQGSSCVVTSVAWPTVVCVN